MTPQRTGGRLLAGLGLAFIAIMTLTPQPGPSSYSPSLCIFCGDMVVQDIILNVVLFVPFALGLRLSGLARWKAIAIAALTTITVELLQMHVIAGRDSSLGDVISNTSGGVLGVALGDTWRLFLVPTARQARRLAWCGLVAWSVIVASTVWALHRSLPPTTVWGQWTPEQLHFDAFPGVVLGASAAGVPFPPGARGSDPAFRRRLLADRVMVQATVVPGVPTQRTAPILGLYDWQKTQIFLLAQRGRAVMFSMRMNAGRTSVRDPVIALDDVFPSAAMAKARSDTLYVSAGVVANALVISARDTRGLARARRVPLSPGLGWSFFIPWSYGFGGETPFLSILWLGGLFLPLAYWGARSGRRIEMLMLSCACAVIGLVVAPLVLRGAPATGWEWLGVAAGAAVGLAIAALGNGVDGKRSFPRPTASRVRAA